MVECAPFEAAPPFAVFEGWVLIEGTKLRHPRIPHSNAPHIHTLGMRFYRIKQEIFRSGGQENGEERPNNPLHSGC